ncbi:hypothetical protein EG329_005388 [Mollisiaceae sp. DMI_Dod_QoI]|nr:hypothetical protein EG329_005388 [Helotiales sp. DMI_Dod_QoI]
MATHEPLQRRTTITAVQPMNLNYMPRARAPQRPVHLQCTHLTMTRLYTNEFCCSNCNGPPVGGWLWRCTQDRELILDDDVDKGIVEKIDPLCDIFENRISPSPRSPAARMSILSFLGEVDDEQLQSYTQEQLQQILKQRAKVLGVAQMANGGFRPQFFYYQPSVDPSSPSRSNTIHDPPSKSSSKPVPKPWFPIPGGECQTKWCQACRPHGIDRSWLSLDGIANGDLPLTAIYGFGFNLLGKRPVNQVKHVANLGLRPSPPTLLKMYPTTHRKTRRRYLGGSSRTPNVNIGLGIFGPKPQSQSQSSSDSQVTTSPDTTKLVYQPTVVASFASTSLPSLVPEVQPSLLETPLSPTNGSFPPTVPFPPSPVPGRRHSFDLLPRLSLVMDIPLPEQTEEEIETIVCPGSSLTAMEEKEMKNGEGVGAFGSGPLEVENGVAFLEESVEDHTADVITQY